jgi:hypothetical protein
MLDELSQPSLNVDEHLLDLLARPGAMPRNLLLDLSDVLLCAGQEGAVLTLLSIQRCGDTLQFQDAGALRQSLGQQAFGILLKSICIRQTGFDKLCLQYSEKQKTWRRPIGRSKSLWVARLLRR